MEIKWITDLLDKWISLTDKKKLAYITGALGLIAGLIIFFGRKSYETQLIDQKNEFTKEKNELIISYNGRISRLEYLNNSKDSIIRATTEAHIKYVEKNEEQVRDILFYTKKYKKVKQ